MHAAHQSGEDIGDRRRARARPYLPAVEEPDFAAVGRRGHAVHLAAEGGEAAQQVEAERVRHGGGVEALKERKGTF